MGDFEVKRETVRKNKIVFAAKASLKIALGLTAAMGLGGCWRWFYPPTGGDPMTTTTCTSVEPMSKTSAVAIADAMLLEHLGIDMQHDVQLILTNGSEAIVFIADGYNASNKIAYEYTAPADYYYSGVENSLLSYDETWLTTAYRFGDHYVINIDGGDANYVEQVMNDFIYCYTNF